MNLTEIQQALTEWYMMNKRDLPWRHTSDPYKIWISEVMLQQTQVDTVIPYYNDFIQTYPTVEHLAVANQDEVLKKWEGLGYYSRARNLYQGVKEVQENYNGLVPSNKTELLNLPGIGEYTAGAILSIAFNKPEPAIDGNVLRVMSRLFHIFDEITKRSTKNQIENLLHLMIPKEDPSSFNQGLMELGAMICTPKSPKCLKCPLYNYCESRKAGDQELLPFKDKRKKTKKVYRMSLIMKDNNQIVLVKRPNQGLLASMWELPSFESKKLLTKKEWEAILTEEIGDNIKLGEKWGQIRHVFSHLQWELSIYFAPFSLSLIEKREDWMIISINELDRLSFPKAYQSVIEELKKTIKQY